MTFLYRIDDDGLEIRVVFLKFVAAVAENHKDPQAVGRVADYQGDLTHGDVFQLRAAKGNGFDGSWMIETLDLNARVYEQKALSIMARRYLI